MKHFAGRLLPDTLEDILSEAYAPVLIVIDCQNDFAESQGHFAMSGVDVSGIQKCIPPIVSLLTKARTAGLPVVHVHQNTLPHGASDSDAWLHFKTRSGRAPDYTLPGSWGAAALPGCEPEDGETIVVKFRPDSFLRTNMEHVLAALGCRTVVICGMFTEGCVESTARSASARDYFTVVAEDAVTSIRKEHHQASINLMRERFTVKPGDDVINAYSTTRKTN